jgi:hypothetical protein
VTCNISCLSGSHCPFLVVYSAWKLWVVGWLFGPRYGSWVMWLHYHVSWPGADLHGMGWAAVAVPVSCGGLEVKACCQAGP